MNQKFTIAALGAGLLLLGAGAGYWLARGGSHDSAAAQAPVGAVVTTAAAEKKPLYYYDPMYPQQKFDKPGKSPFMDMMLVPVYGDDGADSGSVKINARTAQNLGVRLGEASLGTMQQNLQLVGAVAYDERAVVVVQARVNGYIDRLLVRAPLDAVKAGQPLAEILAPEWVAAQEEYLALKKSPQADDNLRRAARQRLLLLGMTEDEVAGVETAGKTRARIVLRAPVSGVIGELAVREGMAVAPGAMLFRINGLSTVWVNAEVPEAQAAGFSAGKAVEATVPAFPGEIFKGRIAALLPEVNATTRTLKARIELANPRGRLAPGMFANITLASAPQRQVLQVPSEAVIQTGTRSVVIVAESGANGAQQFTPTEVETGMESHGMTEIRHGLAKGAKVVLSGQFLIDSEASLKATGTRMSAPPADAAPAMERKP